MSTPIIFRDVDFHQYTITEDCTIYKNSEIVPMDDIIYHSTNGYDYVLLETLSGGLKLFRLEFIMVSSFNPGIQNRWEHFKVNHIDGDIKNCHIDNLTFEEDIEEWRIIEYPEWIKREQYAVSSWGRVKNIETNSILHTIVNGTGYNNVCLRDITRKKFNMCSIHTLLIKNHVMSVIPKTYCVNHIDGDKINNHVSNLEILTVVDNNKHAWKTGLTHRDSAISTEEVDMVIEMLLCPQYNGSPKRVFDAIDHKRFPKLTRKVVKAIKLKLPAYIRSDSKYDIQHIQFPDGYTKTSTIDMIIDRLLDPKYNGSPTAVYNSFDHTEFPYITYDIICKIKYKNNTYIRSDSKYDLLSLDFAHRDTNKN